VSFSIVPEIVNLITTVLSTVGLPGLFALMVIESVGIPVVPSEVVLPFSGFLVVEGVFPFWGALVAALLGDLTGALIGYAIGRGWRHRLAGLGVGHFRIDPQHLDRMDRFFARRGEVAVVAARLVPVLRGYISYPAGTARMHPAQFVAFTLIGSTPFALGFIYAGMVLRSDWNLISQWFQVLDIAFIAVVVAIVLYFILCAVGVLESFTLHRPRPGPMKPTGPGSDPPGSPPP
jgi:membrane protein DedA with SNARE-associated domain